jgi:polysaccharide biosynthesis transport protein
VSKNYELLRTAETDLELFRNELTAKPAKTAESPAKTKSRVRGEILRLVNRLFLTGSPNTFRTVVFAGVEHGDGCSWVCARAGEALASQAYGKVCLVDANFESPMLHRYFGIDIKRQPAGAIVQQGPVLNLAQPLDGGNLWLLSGSAMASGPFGFMNRETLKGPFESIGSEFSHVIVDSPPVNESNDAVTLGRMADGVVLVLAAHTTHREAARRAVATLTEAKVRILGAVLNKRTFPVPEGLYRRL